MSVRAFYGRYAALYDAIATAPGVARWRAVAADALDLDPGDTVVEMGCGTGANLRHLRERVGPEGTVVGVDLTRPLLRYARTRVRAEGWANVHLAQADAARPPIGRADAVLGSFVVGLLADPAAAVDGWCDLASGRVALLDATSSAHPVGSLLNPAFGAFVGAGAPADALAGSVQQALAGGRARRRLDERVRAARDALAARTADRRHEERALGFVGVTSGRVE
ncbi:class I SAM-dependent methyltransferase [Halomarina halobia]|uniref:Class I SAM-dependent methyltransferase n=1 Tax=Halomarina halobia TaxID=3033386 RepID=A0ABD6AB89_9EURY|nr:methyltransferase domain-containing protein [Halomarina sp. PSR21]